MNLNFSNCTYKIVDNGDTAITVIFDEQISEQLTLKIMQLSEHLKIKFDTNIIDVIPAYQSLTISYHSNNNMQKQISKTIASLLKKKLQPLNYSAKTIEIPVCYEPAFAPDLEAVSKHTGLAIKDIIALHSKVEYLVHMLGFLPGFLYLGGLNSQLSCPRKKSPNINIHAGSVGIGGDQTGVYPINSPGGWNIIGRTPVKLFMPNKSQPFLANPLDKVKFIPISPEQYQILSSEINEVGFSDEVS